MPTNMEPQELNASLEKGYAALRQKNTADARAIFETILKSNSENISALMGIAYVCRDMGDTKTMLQFTDKALDLNPKNPYACIIKADQYAADGDVRSATAYYMQAINVAPPKLQLTADLRAELTRAQQRATELAEAFSRHLNERIEKKISAAGSTGLRFKESFDAMMGRIRLNGPETPFPSQPKTYLFPSLPIIEFHNGEDVSWLKDVEDATDDIRHELLSVIDKPDTFSPYVTGENDRPQSDPHGMKDNTKWSAFYLWKDGEIVPENAALCPKTVEAMNKVPFPEIAGRSPNILFSLLKAGAKIPPHHGFLNSRYICHLPLIAPTGCGFRVGSETREWEEGKVWLFDDTIEHEAWNNSDQDRYILLFEAWRPELTDVEQELIEELFNTLDGYSV